MERILHIVKDEKIIDRAIEYFEKAYPNRNDFIVITPTNDYTYKYIKRLDKVKNYTIDDKILIEKANNSSQYKHIIVHMLDDTHIKFINKIKHRNITWINWGADLYNGLLEPRGFQLYRDKQILSKIKSYSFLRKNFGFLASIIDKYRLGKRIKAVKKIRNIAITDDDYNLLINYYPEFKHLKRVSFFYYPVDTILGKELENHKCEGFRIMLGNSSSPTGNHLYALNKILATKVNNEIIIPLSYGDKSYSKYLIQEINSLEKPNIKILTDFLPLIKYNEILITCNNYVYGNLRQEAVGNIIVALYLGAKVYLDRCNPIYNYFTNLGTKVYTLEEITYDNLKTPLTENIQKTNREAIIKKYNLDRLIANITNSFPLIDN